MCIALTLPSGAALIASALGGPVERESKSWFAILSFCATVATVAAFALAILVASATLAFALAERLQPPDSVAEVETSTTKALSAPIAEYWSQAAQKVPVSIAKGRRVQHPR